MHNFSTPSKRAIHYIEGTQIIYLHSSQGMLQIDLNQLGKRKSKTILKEKNHFPFDIQICEALRNITYLNKNIK